MTFDEFENALIRLLEEAIESGLDEEEVVSRTRDILDCRVAEAEER